MNMYLLLSWVFLLYGTAIYAEPTNREQYEKNTFSSIPLTENPDKPKNNQVPGASYLVFEGSEKSITGGVISGSRYVTFYTATGDPVEKREHHFCGYSLDDQLDPSAPKPQPVRCEKVYWDGCRILLVLRKGVPGYFVVFYDKNGNVIKSYRCDKRTTLEDIKQNTYIPIDMSKIEKIEKNYKEWWQVW